MKSLGGTMFFFGVGSAVLYFMNMEFIILAWIDITEWSTYLDAVGEKLPFVSIGHECSSRKESLTLLITAADLEYIGIMVQIFFHMKEKW